MARWNVGKETIQRVRRQTFGGDEGWGPDGRWLGPMEDPPVDISVTIDPAPDEFLNTLPPGTRRKDVIYVISEDEIRTDDDEENPQVLADILIRNGKRYKVYDVQRFQRLIVHWEAIAVRERDEK